MGQVPGGSWNFGDWTLLAFAVYGFCEAVYKLAFMLAKGCLSEYYDFVEWRKKHKPEPPTPRRQRRRAPPQSRYQNQPLRQLRQ